MPAEHGVVYTKAWVVDMVLDIAGYVPGGGIIDSLVVEPSCGHGAFMVAIAERLADEIALCGRNWNELRGSVLGFDTDPNALRVCNKLVRKALEDRGCPQDLSADLVSGWLRCGDFLLDEIPGCDYVVGNPPYVRASDIEREKRDAYCKALPSVTAGSDLYVGFFDRGLDILREGGTLCFICADRWLQNAYGKRLRGRIGTGCSLEALVRMHGVDAFDDEVDAYPAITLIRREPPHCPLRFVNCESGYGPQDVPATEAWIRDPNTPCDGRRFDAFEVDRPNGEDVYPLGNLRTVRFVSRAQAMLPSLEDSGVRIGIGIATGCDDVFVTEVEDLVEPSRMLPLFFMRDYRRGRPERKRWLVNPWDEKGSLVRLEDYPRLGAYLAAHEERLRKRYVSRSDESAWYRTIDRVKPGLLDRDLLLMPDMASQPDPILSRGRYPHHNCYWIASDVWDLRVLGGLLMSDTTRRFVDALGVKMRGGTLRFQAQYLRLVHVPRYEQLDDAVREGLARSFETGNRDTATRFAEAAYEGALQ